MDEELKKLMARTMIKLNEIHSEILMLHLSQPTVKTEVSECEHCWMKARSPHESEWTHMVCDNCHEEIHPS